MFLRYHSKKTKIEKKQIKEIENNRIFIDDDNQTTE